MDYALRKVNGSDRSWPGSGYSRQWGYSSWPGHSGPTDRHSGTSVDDRQNLDVQLLDLTGGGRNRGVSDCSTLEGRASDVGESPCNKKI